MRTYTIIGKIPTIHKKKSNPKLLAARKSSKPRKLNRLEIAILQKSIFN